MVGLICILQDRARTGNSVPVGGWEIVGSSEALAVRAPQESRQLIQAYPHSRWEVGVRALSRSPLPSRSLPHSESLPRERIANFPQLRAASFPSHS